MMQFIRKITQQSQFRPAIIVPTAIALIFSVFTLTAPMDQGRIASAISLGVVNLDTGLKFPPLKVSTKVMEGMAENLPFTVVNFTSEDEAREALDRGDVAVALVFPADFSKRVASSDPIEMQLINTNHLTVLETQLGAQMPMLLQSAFSAGVLMLRQSLAAGKLPDGTFPVTVEVETLHPATNPASLMAPFAMMYTTWLGAFVGSMMLFMASRRSGSGAAAGVVRTIVPIVVTGLAATTIATVVSWTTGSWGNFLCLMGTYWAVQLTLSWLIGGVFAVFGLASVLVVLPVVFYQTTLGGAQAPAAAAPEWLLNIFGSVPFDSVGAVYRGVVLGGGTGFPTTLSLSAGAIGIALIWGGSMYIGYRNPEA